MVDVADTVWLPSGTQVGEYTVGSVYSIDDVNGDSLVDPSANQVVDTGTIFTGINNTTWVNSPGN